MIDFLESKNTKFTQSLLEQLKERGYLTQRQRESVEKLAGWPWHDAYDKLYQAVTDFIESKSVSDDSDAESIILRFVLDSLPPPHGFDKKASRLRSPVKDGVPAAPQGTGLFWKQGRPMVGGRR